jgi:hypothetical protein
MGGSQTRLPIPTRPHFFDEACENPGEPQRSHDRKLILLDLPHGTVNFIMVRNGREVGT